MAIRSSVRYPDGTKKEEGISDDQALAEILYCLIADFPFDAENIDVGYRLSFYSEPAEVITFVIETPLG